MPLVVQAFVVAGLELIAPGVSVSVLPAHGYAPARLMCGNSSPEERALVRRQFEKTVVAEGGRGARILVTPEDSHVESTLAIVTGPSLNPKEARAPHYCRKTGERDYVCEPNSGPVFFLAVCPRVVLAARSTDEMKKNLFLCSLE